MAKSELLASLSIETQMRYPVYIGTHLLASHELLQKHVTASQVFIVTNETVAPLYLQQIQEAYADVQCDVFVLPDGERYKNLSSLTKLYDALIRYKHHRDTTLIALGGGVVGDITGFAAATYQRGVSFIQIPTTLLAQVDASVGGKTAVNHRKAKNMIGAFHQPSAVIIDVNTLETLPQREFRAGIGEVIKYGLLVGGTFFNELQTILQQDLMPQHADALAKLITACCSIKAKFVGADERETGERALLNLGHTFAHALEASTHYQRWVHGEAVAIGLYCAAVLSHQLGYLHESELTLVDSLLEHAKLPRRIPQDISLSLLERFMSQDKKVKDKVLHFVLMKAIGDCFLEKKVSQAKVHSALFIAQNH